MKGKLIFENCFCDLLAPKGWALLNLCIRNEPLSCPCRVVLNPRSRMHGLVCSKDWQAALKCSAFATGSSQCICLSFKYDARDEDGSLKKNTLCLKYRWLPSEASSHFMFSRSLDTCSTCLKKKLLCGDHCPRRVT